MLSNSAHLNSTNSHNSTHLNSIQLKSAHLNSKKSNQLNSTYNTWSQLKLKSTQLTLNWAPFWVEMLISVEMWVKLSWVELIWDGEVRWVSTELIWLNQLSWHQINSTQLTIQLKSTHSHQISSSQLNSKNSTQLNSPYLTWSQLSSTHSTQLTYKWAILSWNEQLRWVSCVELLELSWQMR